MNDPNGGPATTPSAPSAIQSEEFRSAIAQELAKLQQAQPTAAPAPSGIRYAAPEQFLDLDGQIAEVDLAPLQVKIGGEMYRVRRDMTGPQIQAVLRLVSESGTDTGIGEDDVLAALLPGTDRINDALQGDKAAAQRLNSYLDSIPLARSQQFIQRIGAIAGIPGMGVEMGELSAR